MVSSKEKRLKKFPFSRLVPNITTLMSLCVGLTSIRFALTERYELAVIAILIAAILDSMDGRLARLLGATSQFGAELDSLSDLVCFGVAPAIVIYVSSLHEWGNAGWALVLLYVIASALRLARFNADLIVNENEPSWIKRYFKGVPIPAAAFLSLTPMMLSFAIGEFYFKYSSISAVMLIISGVLMITRLPTFALKGRQINHQMVFPLMLGVGLTITSLITAFWVTLTSFGVLYLISLPFSYRSFRRNLKAE